MSWRTVIIQGNAKLDFGLGFMVVRKQSGTSRVHISEINILLIESTTVSITTALLSELTKNKIKVIFCDEKHNPESELLPYFGSHDTSRKVRQQIGWSDENKKAVWSEIVKEKIFQQKLHLESVSLHTQCNLLESYISTVKLGDVTNREGHAAKVYFNALFGLDFTRDDESPINAALNYGYSIILSCFSREVVNNGYITQLGIFHDNVFNQFNLASDLMEPFRILVDRKVFSMQPKKFESEEKMILVGILNEGILIEDKVHTVTNAIKIYSKSIFEALESGDVKCIKNYTYEL